MNTNKKVTPASKFFLLKERKEKWMNLLNNGETSNCDREDQIHQLLESKKKWMNYETSESESESDRKDQIHKLLGSLQCITKEDRINLFKKIDFEEFPGAKVYQPSRYINNNNSSAYIFTTLNDDFGSLYPSLYTSTEKQIPQNSEQKKIDKRCKIINEYLSNKPEKRNIREEIIIHDPRYNALEIYTNPRAITNIVIILYQMKVPLMLDVYRYIIDALGIPNNREINMIIDTVIGRIYQVKQIQ